MERQKEKVRILSRLGEGAFGYVYLVKVGSGRNYKAVKRVIKLSCVKSREMATMRKLHHQNIISFTSTTLTQSSLRIPSILHRSGVRMPLYLNYEMEPYDTSLATLIKLNKSGLPANFVRDIAYQVLSGLSYAHSKGVAHRDIKPDNLLIMSKSHKCVIADWGSASSISSLPRAPPAYMSPEQMLGVNAGSGASDVWGLGVSLYEALTGNPFLPLIEVHNELDIFLYMVRKCGGLTESVFSSAESELKGAHGTISSFLDTINDEQLERGGKEIIPLRNELSTYGRFGVLICNMLRLSVRSRIRPDDALSDDCFNEEREKWGAK